MPPFSHTAMATTFELSLPAEDPAYAKQASLALFAEIDRMEAQLSLFEEGSDIFRINHSAPGEILRISEETHEILLQALDLQALTQNAFNITLGNYTAQLRETPGTLIPAPDKASPSLMIDPNEPLVQVLQETPEGTRLNLDLGAIGKGFALDQAAKFLSDWEISHALLNGGDSTVLAIGSQHPEDKKIPEGWTITLAGDGLPHPIRLLNQALGASGTSQQGKHIIDPRRHSLEYQHHRTWALAPSAAIADALSTAFMTMTVEEIQKCLSQLGPHFAAVLEHPLTHQLQLLTPDAEISTLTHGKILCLP